MWITSGSIFGFQEGSHFFYFLYECIQVLGRVLLPSVSLITSSPATDLELWELLRMLPSTTRYRLYAEQRELSERSPYLAAVSRMAVYETRKVRDS
jgi:hypothetical protein